jgi:cellulose synthase/poly-beta-1,6-N-acetylglucosamine synthase-like glycosyltransferase
LLKNGIPEVKGAGGELGPLAASMISFIIPAHNEELWIGKCLASIRSTMEKL